MSSKRFRERRAKLGTKLIDTGLAPALPVADHPSPSGPETTTDVVQVQATTSETLDLGLEPKGKKRGRR